MCPVSAIACKAVVFFPQARVAGERLGREKEQKQIRGGGGAVLEEKRGGPLTPLFFFFFSRPKLLCAPRARGKKTTALQAMCAFISKIKTVNYEL